MSRSRLLSAIIIGATLAIPAAADQSLNCNAYAGKAVAQQEQNVALGCGFSGGAWSADFNAHFGWCQNAGTTMADLTTEDKARVKALAECGQKPAKTQEACQGYASNAVFFARLAKISQCGFSGGAWTENYGAHFNWCMGAAEPARNSEREARVNKVQGCLAALKNAKQTACKAYAQAALVQNDENKTRKCGFGGSRWSNDANAHFQWCMGAKDAALKAEADIRNAALRDSCKPKSASRHCWTETVARVGLPPWETRRICKNN